MMFYMQRQYVVYPPEGPRPPSPEELREMAREMARKKNNNWELQFNHDGSDKLYTLLWSWNL